MRKRFRPEIVLTLLVMFAVGFAMTCSSDQITTYAAENQIVVGAANTGVVKLPVKAKYKLEAKTTTGTLKYKSSKRKVATVTKKGLIRARKPGKTIITIKGTGVAKKIPVTVMKKNKYKKVKAISFEQAPEIMAAGDHDSVVVGFTPANSSNKNIKFISSEPDVITVDQAGGIIADQLGTATITAVSCANKKATVSVDIQVVEAVERTVTFDSLGGTEVPPQKVMNGKKAVEPEPPVLDNADFGGWYLDGASEPYDFSTPVTEDITLYAHWNVINVSADGVIDAGDLVALESAGKIQMSTDDESGVPRAIIGQFTDEKVQNKGDARKVLLSMASLFNKTYDEDGNQIETEFNVQTSDIRSETVSTPAADAEDDVQCDNEIIYTYSPTTQAGVRVQGGEIKISTDTAGNVTGLHATYDPFITTLTLPAEQEPDLDEINYKAKIYLMQKLREEGIKNLNENMLLANMTCQPELIVRMGDEFVNKDDKTGRSEVMKTDPYYAYKVRVTTLPPGTGGPDYTEPDATGTDNPNDSSEGDDLDTTFSGESLTPETTVPAIDWTVYIDANTLEARDACDNVSYADWENVSLWLTNSKGETKNADLRYQTIQNSSNNRYQFYDPGRKISIFQVCEYQGKNEQGTHTFGAADRSKTSALSFRCPASSIATTATTANTLLTNAETVYDFYKDVLGRTSYDDAGANIRVGYYDDNGNNANAWWWADPGCITFSMARNGRVYTRTLDTMGHEFTHAVIDFTVGTASVDHGFERSGESGSLDEGFCDIMGNLVQKYSGDKGADDWTHGEDRAVNGTFDPSRDFKDPTSLSAYVDNYSNYSTATDNIYWNCTIFTHAYYLMASDSRINLSTGTWGKLFYRALSKLSTDSDFLDARYAILSEAAWMRLTSLQQQVINEAFDSVGIIDPKQITVTLSWGSNANDLDLHMIGPIGKSYYEVNWKNKLATKVTKLWIFTLKRTLLARLSYQPNGTEVIRVYNLDPGYYYFLVNVPSNDSSVLKNSSARIRFKVGTGPEILTYPALDVNRPCWLPIYFYVDGNKNVTYHLPSQKYENEYNELYRYGDLSTMKEFLYKRY